MRKKSNGKNNGITTMIATMITMALMALILLPPVLATYPPLEPSLLAKTSKESAPAIISYDLAKDEKEVIITTNDTIIKETPKKAAEEKPMEIKKEDEYYNNDSSKGTNQDDNKREAKEQHVIIVKTEQGFSVVRANISYNITNIGQEIKEIEAERQSQFRELLAVLKPQVSVVAPKNVSISEDTLNAYVKALNEQTKDYKDEIKEKIVPTDNKIAEQVVKREIAKKAIAKAGEKEVTKDEVLKQLEEMDGFENKNKVTELVQKGEDNFFKRLYFIIKEGLNGKQEVKQSIDEYSKLITYKDRIIIDNNSEQLNPDMTPEQAISLIYKIK